MGAGYGPSIITDGLVMNLDLFNKRSYGGTGTLLKDLSNQKKHATIYNSPTYFANKLIFTNGSSNYIQTQFSSPSSSYTVQIGFKPYSNNVDQRIIGTRTGSTDTVAITAGLNSGYLSAWTGSAWVNIAPISNNQFYELTIVATYASNTKYYLNGVLVYTMNNFRPFPQDAVICSNFLGYGSPLNGAIYYARAYNRILNEEEINIMYSQFNERYIIRKLLNPNLVSYFDAAIYDSYPGTGTTWTDLAGNSNGTLTNGPTFSMDADGAILFDGSNDYIQIGSLPGSFASFTVDIWFYPTSISNYENPIDCNWAYSGNNSYANVGPRLEMNSAGNLAWVYSNSTNPFVYYYQSVISSGMQANKWYHVAITYDGSINSSVTYLYGVNTGLTRGSTGGPTGFIGNITNVNIARGCSSAGSERYLTGKVAISKIFNRALTSDEIYQNFNAVRGRFGL